MRQNRNKARKEEEKMENPTATEGHLDTSCFIAGAGAALLAFMWEYCIKPAGLILAFLLATAAVAAITGVPIGLLVFQNTQDQALAITSGIFGGLLTSVLIFFLLTLAWEGWMNMWRQTGRKVALRCQQRKDQARQKAAGKLQI